MGHASGQNTEERLSRDVSFSILSNHRRRYVLHHLKRVGEPTTIRELAEQVAAWENDCEIEELTYKQRKRVYTSLHQTHLPKLDTYDIIDYEQGRGVATLTDRATDLDIYLEVVERDDVPWSQYYLGLASVSLAVLAASGLGLPFFVQIPGLTYAAGIAVALLLSASVHAYQTRQARLGATELPAGVEPSTPTSERNGILSRLLGTR
ncbi:hypothetical protein AUR64_18020 [Haloprofundus marisrubri]|uniref:DUF7344 domain-containing protein n=2 Tax=Haloprofundus marisrubri TaxID=1514971 RepID=A0A0W1R631_9EURY|nr:hypothetical protein AUR64_18020 [Haloprofundus marisrubri]